MPLIWISWRWYRHDLGINQIETVARYSGDWTLRFLLASLAITPLRRIPGLGPLQRFRRMIGLFAFFYGGLHGLHYFARDAQWDKQVILEDLTIRRFFIAGMLAWSLMIPLAATSFDAAIRRMGGKRWQRLHRLVYLSAVCGVVHYLWQGKIITQGPLKYALLLAVLLLYRVVVAVRKRAPSVRTPAYNALKETKASP
jgi:methionine sulfoxide reductase heme-binding subunit